MARIGKIKCLTIKGLVTFCHQKKKDKDRDNLFNVKNTGSGFLISRARGS